jgi:3-hydroxy-9,10-secoandrosta-1,3,5(10)-triene-9,17-dione monooxygenase reductase component
MSLEPAEFRRVMGHWATGVAIVAAQRPDGAPCGMTANAVCSLSLHPPLLLVCVEHAADTHDCIREAGAFAINMLDSGQERLARRFADWEAADKFTGVAYRAEQTGAPVLEDALAWADCTLHAEYDGGDHTIFVGLIGAADARDGRPLIFFRGGYGPP